MSIRKPCLCKECVEESQNKYDEESITAQLREAKIISQINDLTFKVKRLERDMIDVRDKQKFYDNKSNPKESKYADIWRFIERCIIRAERDRQQALEVGVDKNDYESFIQRLDGYIGAYKNLLSFLREQEND